MSSQTTVGRQCRCLQIALAARKTALTSAVSPGWRFPVTVDKSSPSEDELPGSADDLVAAMPC